jgi:hypothetical protein
MRVNFTPIITCDCAAAPGPSSFDAEAARTGDERHEVRGHGHLNDLHAGALRGRVEPVHDPPQRRDFAAEIDIGSSGVDTGAGPVLRGPGIRFRRVHHDRCPRGKRLRRRPVRRVGHDDLDVVEPQIDQNLGKSGAVATGDSPHSSHRRPASIGRRPRVLHNQPAGEASHADDDQLEVPFGVPFGACRAIRHLPTSALHDVVPQLLRADDRVWLRVDVTGP